MGGPAASVLERAAAALGAAGADAKWAAPPFHATAAFLGETDPARLPEVRACLAAAEAEAPSPREAALESLGAFPSWERPRVLWAGFGAGAGDLAAAGRALNRRLAEAGFPVEERPFVPHATLARLRSGRGLDELKRRAEPWRRREAWAGAVLPCGAPRLYSSVLTPRGAVHAEVP